MELSELGDKIFDETYVLFPPDCSAADLDDILTVNVSEAASAKDLASSLGQHPGSGSGTLQLPVLPEEVFTSEMQHIEAFEAQDTCSLQQQQPADGTPRSPPDQNKVHELLVGYFAATAVPWNT